MLVRDGTSTEKLKSPQIYISRSSCMIYSLSTSGAMVHGSICLLSLRVRVIGVFNHAPVTVSQTPVPAAIFCDSLCFYRLTKSFATFFDFGLCYSGARLDPRLLHLVIRHIGGCEMVDGLLSNESRDGCGRSISRCNICSHRSLRSRRQQLPSRMWPTMGRRIQFDSQKDSWVLHALHRRLWTSPRASECSEPWPGMQCLQRVHGSDPHPFQRGSGAHFNRRDPGTMLTSNSLGNVTPCLIHVPYCIIYATLYNVLLDKSP